jgi:hypothetical protein
MRVPTSAKPSSPTLKHGAFPLLARPFRGLRICPLKYVRLHGVKGIRRICKPPRGKMLFHLPQERIALVVASKLNRNASLVIRRGRGRRAELAHAQPSQPGQRRPSQLIDHGRLLPRLPKTKKTARPMAVTINKLMASTNRKVRQPSAAEGSPSRKASRQFWK